MTNQNDSFIDEVAEEVRRDRLFGYLRRYGWIGVVAVFALVGGAAFNEWQKVRDQATAQALGDALYIAVSPEAPADQATALAGLEIEGAAVPLKLMLEAAALAEDGQMDAAATQFAAIAEDQTTPRVWRDLATLKRLQLLGRGLEPEARLAALEPLAQPGAPYRVLAVEQQALAQLDAGDRAAARATLEALIEDQEASPGLRLRVVQLMLALGEEPDGA